MLCGQVYLVAEGTNRFCPAFTRPISNDLASRTHNSGIILTPKAAEGGSTGNHHDNPGLGSGHYSFDLLGHSKNKDKASIICLTFLECV